VVPASEPNKEETTMPNKLLIKGGHVVTMDPALGDQPDSDILVSDGVIVEVRPRLETSAPDAEVFSEMRLALAAERSRANAPALARGEQVATVDLHQRDMLRLATLDGARVWNLDDQIGSLTPGKQADIAIIDMRSAHLDGFGDPVAVLVLGAGPADVETVIVEGEVVKRDGMLVGARVDWARKLMHETRDRLRS
jgi:cytosine/adenosine deaminase-related metal-dependent hydrolase